MSLVLDVSRPGNILLDNLETKISSAISEAAEEKSQLRIEMYQEIQFAIEAARKTYKDSLHLPLYQIAAFIQENLHNIFQLVSRFQELPNERFFKKKIDLIFEPILSLAKFPVVSKMIQMNSEIQFFGDFSNIDSYEPLLSLKGKIISPKNTSKRDLQFRLSKTFLSLEEEKVLQGKLDFFLPPSHYLMGYTFTIISSTIDKRESLSPRKKSITFSQKEHQIKTYRIKPTSGWKIKQGTSKLIAIEEKGAWKYTCVVDKDCYLLYTVVTDKHGAVTFKITYRECL